MSRWEGKNEGICEAACEMYDHWEDEEEAMNTMTAPEVDEVENVFKFGVVIPEGAGFNFGGGSGGEVGGGGYGPRGRGRGVSNKPAWMT